VGTRRVLIVDDDAILCSVATRILEEAGWDVLACAENAVEGINLARVLKPDAVLLDVSMPGTSGLDVVSDLKQAGTAVVICSGFPSLLASARNSDADAVVDKSDLVTLPEVLAGVVGGSGPAR
jgi:CheY-like chemotaxis protein